MLFVETALSTCVVPESTGIRRDSPRPLDLRQPDYDTVYDWTTLFYDVYRVGQHVVFQGPPLFGWWDLLKTSAILRNHMPLFGEAAFFLERPLGGDIWVEAPWNFISFASLLGRYDLRVQPNHSDEFADRRVLLSISKDNDILWIADWIAFHQQIHGANAVLLYDNGSTSYSAASLEAELRARFPDVIVRVVAWPFLFGPQGVNADSDGSGALPWDSNFAQTGALQHARFRFLGAAKSVLNCDIDELVISEDGLSVFAEVEASASGIQLFGGRWIGTYTTTKGDAEPRRHKHFFHTDARLGRCPTKWCARPSALDRKTHSFGIHRILGAQDIEQDARFDYRHFKAISTNWKYQRWKPEQASERTGPADEVLRKTFSRLEPD